MIQIKHEMDNDFKITTLNEAFLEALELSEGCACEQERCDYDLLTLLKNDSNLINNIKDEYKYKIVESYGFTIKK